jgi:hypothetical protein
MRSDALVSTGSVQQPAKQPPHCLGFVNFTHVDGRSIETLTLYLTVLGAPYSKRKAVSLPTLSKNRPLNF